MALVVLMVLLAGCTGLELDETQRLKLDDLYLSGTGRYIHYGAGRFVADTVRANGARAAGINLRVPYSRLEVDDSFTG